MREYAELETIKLNSNSMEANRAVSSLQNKILFEELDIPAKTNQSPSAPKVCKKQKKYKNQGNIAQLGKSVIAGESESSNDLSNEISPIIENERISADIVDSSGQADVVNSNSESQESTRDPEGNLYVEIPVKCAQIVMTSPTIDGPLDLFALD